MPFFHREWVCVIVVRVRVSCMVVEGNLEAGIVGAAGEDLEGGFDGNERGRPLGKWVAGKPRG